MKRSFMPKLPQEASPLWANINGGEYTAWTMPDGSAMVGKLIQNNGSKLTVLRENGTSCHVPADVCRPATVAEFNATKWAK